MTIETELKQSLNTNALVSWLIWLYPRCITWVLLSVNLRWIKNRILIIKGYRCAGNYTHWEVRWMSRCPIWYLYINGNTLKDYRGCSPLLVIVSNRRVIGIFNLLVNTVFSVVVDDTFALFDCFVCFHMRVLLSWLLMSRLHTKNHRFSDSVHQPHEGKCHGYYLFKRMIFHVLAITLNTKINGFETMKWPIVTLQCLLILVLCLTQLSIKITTSYDAESWCTKTNSRL